MEQLVERVKNFPEKPGVYQFIDENESIIYIGKAKNLKKRVQSYFNKKSKESRKIKILVEKIFKIEYSIVETESDALLLENTFIKRYQPKYNILLKDDKTYPWICIKNESFPRVMLTRKYVVDGSTYYGPFSSGLLAKTMLDLVKKLYPIRTCNYNLSDANIISGKIKPCLEYHIGNCLAPCILKQTNSNYNENVKQIESILNGSVIQVQKILKLKMETACRSLNYELANELKKKIDILSKYQSKSIITGIKISETEVYNILEKENYCVVNFLKISEGSIVQTYTLEIKKLLEEKPEDILSSVIIEIRKRVKSHCPKIVVPFHLDFKIAQAKYIVPKKGDYLKLLELSFKNCLIYSQEIELRLIKSKTDDDKTLETLKKDLQLSHLPTHIECFDNSNMQGENPVSSCVVFRNGKPSKREYRHFLIKSVQGPDDFATMKEVVFRRYKKLLSEKQNLPQLVVVDGGKGQVNAAYESLMNLKIDSQISIIGIAKRLEEIYYPHSQYPLYLDKRSGSLKIIQHIRNEAHRFGIKLHRKRVIKSNSISQLVKIKGIGNETVKILYSSYKKLEDIKTDRKENIEKLIGTARTKILLEYINKNLH